MKNKEIMKKKNLWGLLTVLFVAVFAFAACSDDDNDDKTGTYEYRVINSFDGDIESINKVNDAFQQAFGAESAPFTLTGTKSECNRKAKEYAMKAQAALANDGSFTASIKLVNITTDELIHSFDIKQDENIKPKTRLHYELCKPGIILYFIKGNHVKISKIPETSYEEEWIAYDDVVKEDRQFIKLNILSTKPDDTRDKGHYLFTMWEGTSEKELCSFIFYYDRKYEDGNEYY